MLDAKTIIQGDSVGWLVWHDTDGAGTLADLSAGYTCNITVGGTAVNRAVTVMQPAYSGAAANTAFVAGLTPAETLLFAINQFVVSVKIAKAASGFSGEQHGILTVESAAPVLALPTDVETLTADLAAVRAARMDLASGKRVDDVMRDGRRITKGRVTLQGLTDLISILERDIDQATNLAAGYSRRSPIAIGW